MSMSTNSVLCYCKFLMPNIQSISVVSLRHYPRWSHRRPVGVVENELAEEEQRTWKLNIERDVKNVRNPSSEVVCSNQSFRKFVNQTVSEVEANHKKIVKQAQSTPPYKEVDSYATRYSELKYKVNAAKFEAASIPKKLVEDNAFRKEWFQTKIAANNKSQSLKLKNSAMKLGVPCFSDLGTDDKILSQYITNVKSRKRREKTRRILLEGKRLIKDAIDAGIIPESIFFSQISDLKFLDLPQTGIKIYKLTYKQLCMWSDVITPQGVIAFVKIPDISKTNSPGLPLTIICDNIRDPGNLGTILRTCSGIGCQQVFLTKGCVDLWEPKVLRAGAGAHFRVPIQKDLTWNDILIRISKNCCAFIAENNTLPVHDLQSPSAEKDDKYSEISDSDSDSVHSSTSTTLEKPNDHSLPPVIPYYSFNYPSVSSLVLVVGGETEGVSFDAYKLVSETGGARLNIPLSNNVESLNVSTALGIIGFEIKKQLFMFSLKTSPEKEDSLDVPVVIKNS